MVKNAMFCNFNMGVAYVWLQRLYTFIIESYTPWRKKNSNRTVTNSINLPTNVNKMLVISVTKLYLYFMREHSLRYIFQGLYPCL